MFKTIFLLLLTTIAFAKYTNCEFKNTRYTEICERAHKKGVPIHNINTYLLSPKTKDLDLLSFKFFDKTKIQHHRKNEQKANNTLVKYIPEIVEHVKEYKKVYDKAEKKYHVNREVVASILMKETRLGKIEPSFDAFRVFNTLVVKVEPEDKRDNWLLEMGKSNLVSIIEYCYKKNLKPSQCTLPSSYAGAVGIPQFMPSSFVYIDGYKDKVGDLTKMEDAIMSASKYLNQKASFDKLIDWKKMKNIEKIESDWYNYAFEHENASFVYAQSKRTGKEYKCFTCDKKEMEYYRKYAGLIMKYNNSSNYAVGVLRLAYETNMLLKKTKK